MGANRRASRQRVMLKSPFPANLLNLGGPVQVSGDWEFPVKLNSKAQRLSPDLDAKRDNLDAAFETPQPAFTGYIYSLTHLPPGPRTIQLGGQ